MGERAFGNLHEQSTIFLAAVWLHALFVDATTATTLGWAWLGFRFAYVAIWALTAGNIMPAILLATMPMYGIIIWLFATVRAMRSRARFAAWRRRALQRPCAWASWMRALWLAAGWRLRLTGGTTAFLSMVLSSFLFLRINLFANRVLKKAYRRATFSRVTILHVDARALRQ